MRQLGDVFADRYVVVKKLGWGHFSTVWMARDDRPTCSTAPKVSAPLVFFRYRGTQLLWSDVALFIHLGGSPQTVYVLHPSAGVDSFLPSLCTLECYIVYSSNSVHSKFCWPKYPVM